MQFQKLDDYVKYLGGTRPLNKVLIANNGIAAVKAIRSVRRWCYEVFGREREIKFVAMATPEDLKANAEFIRMADEVVEVPGGRNLNNYANVDLIVQTAKKYQVDGVWPGWGHASENPSLPTSLEACGIVFIGPPAGPMYALGDKIGSTIIAQNADVPVIAWNGADIKFNYKAEYNIPPEVYNKACIQSSQECLQAVERIGLPVMIKASEGGGGKGIRKVTEISNVEAAFRQVQSEVPGSPIFVMKLASKSRHLEVQLLCDKYGQAIALSGRDCSVQRRHQKILEEGPPSAAEPSVWREMERAAVRLAKEVNYINAGTVEYLYREEDKTFCFLELNPRLQVEHPVTEMITGVNLPASQFQVAMGIPLNRIPDIRRYYKMKDIYGDDKIDFDNTEPRGPEGHVIAARITAENPNKGFQPTSGRIEELNFRSSRNVWGYFSVDSSGRVHEFADSQFGHLFAWGENRDVARKHLALALNDMSIRGDIRTTIEYLKDLLEDPGYRSNAIDTTWLDERIRTYKQAVMIDHAIVALVGAGCECFEQALKQEAEYVSQLSRGQLPNPQLLSLQFKSELIFENIKYILTATRTGPSTFNIELNGQIIEQEIRSLADGGYLVLMGGKSHVAYLKPEIGAKRLVMDGQTYLFVDEYDPSQVRAAMGGKLLRFLVEDGASVKKDFPIAEIEVMKMTMPLLAPENGTVTIVKPAGSVMEPGDVICTFLLDDISKIHKSEVFKGAVPNMGPPNPRPGDDMPHHILSQAVSVLNNIMEGYSVPLAKRQAALAEFNLAQTTPLLPALELADLLSRIKNTMPYALHDELREISKDFRKQVDESVSSQGKGIKASMSATNLVEAGSSSPVHANSDGQSDKNVNAYQFVPQYAQKVTKAVADFIANASGDAKSQAEAAAPQINAIVSKYLGGLQAYALGLASSLLRKYLDVESCFAELELSDSPVKDEALQELRRRHSANLRTVFDLALSHAAVKSKNVCALELLEKVENCVRKDEEMPISDPLVNSTVRDGAVKLLRDIAALNVESTNDVALESRQMLIELQKPSYHQSLTNIQETLRKVAGGDVEARSSLINSTEAILHMIMDIMLNSKDEVLKQAALEVYVRRVYNTYSLVDFETRKLGQSSGQVAAWHFYSDAETYGSNVSQIPQGMLNAQSSANLQALLSAEYQGDDELISISKSDSVTNLADDAAIGSKRKMFSKQKSSRARAGSGWEGESGDDSTSVKSAGLGDADSNSASGLNLSIHANAGGKFSGGEGVPTNIVRHGILSYFDGLDSLKENFSLLLSQFDTSTQAEGDKPVNALHIVLREKISPNDVVASPAPLTRQKSSALQLGEESTATRLSSFLAENQAALRKAGVRRVTFAVPTLSSGQRQTIVAGHGSGFFTFRESANFLEDRLVRHIETPLAFQLELKRLSNFNISLVPLGKNLSMSHTVHVYQAIPKKSEGGAAAGGGGDDDGEGGGSGGATKRRFFVRALVRQAGKVQSTPSDDESAVYSYPGPERVLVQALAALEAIQGGSGANSILGAQNHIFLNVLGDASVDPLTAERICRVIARRYAKRLLTARVAEVELKFNTRLDSESPQIPVRIISSNPTGFALRVDSYIEAVDPLDPNRTLLYSISASDGGVGASLAAMGLDPGASSVINQDIFSIGDTGENDHDIEGLHSSTSGTGSITGLGSFHGLESTFPYPVSTPFEERRARAIAAGTCFVYDIPALFQKALENQWRSYSRRRDHIAIPSSSTLLKAQELVLDDEMDATGSQLADSGLVFTSRPPGSNKIAMVAWLFHMVTPQYSSGNGREVMIIANDLTFKAGSFGTREDELFARASKYARERGIPRLYIAANSGARIGIAEEVKRAFRVKWVDDNDPSKGFSYVYVDPNEYKLLGPEGRKSVISEPVYDESNNIIHYKLTAIVGEGRDLGVENLRGSGMIAGETSRAYEETFTATYVAGRTVGIGAYLVRLGQRTIQKGTNAPIILTGYQALNSLMGRAVYSSNAQLGGPAIMYNNGVTHMCVRDDLEGISSLLTWLTYVPERKGLSLPLTTLYSGDSIERDVEYMPSPDVISDPRLMLAGVESSTGWVSGLFDRGSWMELLGGWAKTIITGRARLGCIPVGVVIPESRTVECKKPADPATLDSKETLIMQAGNVWFPDSSYKTAQAIRDINNEGLPLVFIANFRGFSGGQRDMFDEVLKYGSMIVDALVDFKQPVIVYLPPFGELRGGAWVVMDATINEDMMEMYAAPEARGGVLEPAGTVSIKFRTKDMIAAMHRVDPAIIELDKQLAKAEEAKSSADDLKKIKTLIEQREKKLMPVYKQLALEVADLHDRPGRMMAKRVISGVVPWRESRRFFYWRLRRRLAEDEVCKQLMKEGELKSLAVARETLKKIGEVAISSVSPTSWTADDRGVVEWIQSAQGGRSIEALKTALRQERIVKQLTDLGMQDSTAVLKGIMGIIQTLSQNGRTSERDQFVQTLRRGVFLLGTGSSGSTNSNNGSASS